MSLCVFTMPRLFSDSELGVYLYVYVNKLPKQSRKTALLPLRLTKKLYRFRELTFPYTLITRVQTRTHPPQNYIFIKRQILSTPDLRTTNTDFTKVPWAILKTRTNQDSHLVTLVAGKKEIKKLLGISHSIQNQLVLSLLKPERVI